MVCAVARNVSGTIQGDFHRITKALKSFEKIFWIIVESDSTDDSREKLQEISEKNQNVKIISLGNLRDTYKDRTAILAHARNTYLQELLASEEYLGVEIIAIADLNNLNSELTSKSIDSALALSDWAMCTANQRGPYYDIWALRHPLWSPNDCWEQLDFYRKYSRKLNRTLDASVNMRMLRIHHNSDPIEVHSAFGGFALVRKNFLSTPNLYEGLTESGRQVCEHVSFCNEIRNQGGRILVVPSLINARYTDHSFRSTLLFKIYRNFLYPIKYFSRRLK